MDCNCTCVSVCVAGVIALWRCFTPNLNLTINMSKYLTNTNVTSHPSPVSMSRSSAIYKNGHITAAY